MAISVVEAGRRGGLVGGRALARKRTAAERLAASRHANAARGAEHRHPRDLPLRLSRKRHRCSRCAEWIPRRSWYRDGATRRYHMGCAEES